MPTKKEPCLICSSVRHRSALVRVKNGLAHTYHPGVPKMAEEYKRDPDSFANSVIIKNINAVKK